ncbi:MAG: tetratricopeptide repeat protein [Steroidobacteraceae bacterium]
MTAERMASFTRGTSTYLPCLLFVSLISMSAARAVLASAPRVAAGSCDADVQRYLARLPTVRAAERQIVGLLNAKHYRSAIPALRSAAARYGDAWAGDTLGHLYAAGLGVRRNAKTAFHWYLWSAKRGDRYAQRQLADAYLNGVGVARNATRAAYWSRIGVAPYELARSDYWLAETYASGTLAPANRLKDKYYLDDSLRILRQLAREPNGEADFDLGRAYAGGHGVGRDRAQALKYFCRALALDYGPAAARIQKLEEPDR